MANNSIHCSIRSTLAPLNVLVLEADQSLVGFGNERFAITEEFYDATRSGLYLARTDFVSVYDVAMSGGEPYSRWL